MRKEDSVSKLKLLLKMLDSQIKLDSGGMVSKSGMREGVDMVRSNRMQVQSTGTSHTHTCRGRENTW